jgi:hypothetical protein
MDGVIATSIRGFILGREDENQGRRRSEMAPSERSWRWENVLEVIEKMGTMVRTCKENARKETATENF